MIEAKYNLLIGGTNYSKQYKLEEEEKPSYQIILDSLIELRNQIKQGRYRICHSVENQ